MAQMNFKCYTPAMRDQRNRNFDRGRNSFNRGRNSFGDKQMFKAVCSNCGNECEVPFKPTGEKPVYCSDCFGKMGNKNDRKPFRRPDRDDRGNYNDKNQVLLESIDSKLEKIISLLQPAPAKKVVKEKTSKEAKKSS